MNSLRNKLRDFKNLILNEIDAFLITESKLDNNFPMLSLKQKDTDCVVRTETNVVVRLFYL